jgi:hypothetical protein
MIKKLIKILSSIILGVILILFYLSFVGIKTEKFNEKIISKIFEINNKIKLELKSVKFLLDPYNFTVNITTKNPTILLDGNTLQLKDLKINIFLKSLIYDELLINDLQIFTKKIQLNDLILLARSFKNSTELFLLDRVIKSGSLTADIKLKFDDNGKINNDYQINGFVENANFDYFKQLSVNNLNLKFDINKKKYSLTKVKGDFNDIQLSSSLIEVTTKKNLFLIKGKILSIEKNFNIKQLNFLSDNLLKNINIKKAILSSSSNFSFNINKKLKFNDLNIESKINLKQLVVKNDFKSLKSYLPNFEKILNFENHKIVFNYDKNKLKIKGKGNMSIADKYDTLVYELIKNNDKFRFNTKINLKNSKLLINFLDYEKKENSDASVSIKGSFKKNNSIKFDLISLIEENNKILFKKLNLDRDFKVISMDSFSFDYLNNKKIKNALSLKKNNEDYIIEGNSLDATNLINKIMDDKNENPSFFSNFNSKIDVKINKTFIDEYNYINNLSGSLNFKNNEINELNLRSIFPNNKKISLSIKTNDKQEKITKLVTDYPKPLIKRYDFIKGFEEGFLVFHSVKKEGISNALLTIDKFKVKEVPVFAKLLSLASLQGIADLLTGEGIRFTDFEMKFKNEKGLTTIEEMYAIGPAVSILMDGYVESKKIVSLRGTLVPATTINRTIAAIPLLGNILVGKKIGEGVFGVSFKIKGKLEDLKTTVNPVKTLTPRFITRTLEKIKKN